MADTAAPLIRQDLVERPHEGEHVVRTATATVEASTVSATGHPEPRRRALTRRVRTLVV